MQIVEQKSGLIWYLSNFSLKLRKKLGLKGDRIDN